MRAAVLLAGFASFLICLSFHVILWRAARPRAEALALVAIFFVAPAAVAVVVMAITSRWVDVLAVLLLHSALSAAYVQTYPAAQARSPSLEIAYAVGRSMPGGLSREELLASLTAGALVHDRLNDLVANGLVRVTGDRYTLARSSSSLSAWRAWPRSPAGVAEPWRPATERPSAGPASARAGPPGLPSRTAPDRA
ncbi:MAG TPA: hypothetical protein VEH80_09365 [Candidatus Bathyarchaeia archaeon]|nr:hypothetical protein [Candidatus Bathyarchaeia archaeon]